MSDQDAGTASIRRLRRVLAFLFLAGAIGIDIGFLLHFSNLRSNSFILILALLTPLVVGLTLVASPLVLVHMPRQRMVVALRSGAFLILIIDAIVFLGPLIVHGATGHDTAPKFVVNATPTALLASTPIPLTATATSIPAGPLMFTFSPTTGEGSTIGNAVLGTTSVGTIELQLQHLHTLNGPNLHVFLSRVARPQNDSDVRNGYDLGPLLATDGDKDYPVPAGVEIAQIHSVVIYCLSFNAIFGIAQ